MNGPLNTPSDALPDGEPAALDGQAAPDSRARRFFRRYGMLIAALLVLVPSMAGFVNKFLELVAVYRGASEGAFAVGPIVNYLLASAGFLLLFLWAALNGMFGDIESPKRTMLENEARLDREMNREAAHVRA